MSEQRHLARLIEQLADERGWSMRELARRANIPAPTIHKITWPGGVVVPRRETLDAIAKGFGVPVTLLLDAAAMDSGLKTVETDSEDGDIEMTVRVMRELSPEKRREISALARAMLANTNAT